MRYYLEQCQCSETWEITDQRFLTSFLPWKIANWIENLLVIRMHPRNVLSFKIYHILEGLISGIPICCIFYFLKITPFRGPCPPREFFEQVPFLLCPYCKKTGRWKKFIPPKNIEEKKVPPSPWTLKNHKRLQKYILTVRIIKK